jgi:pyruvate dehydrogenase E1 component
MAFPTVRAYDPAWAYETVVIILDGMRKLYQEGETAIYYITVHNEDYEMPAMPAGVEDGIIKGIYKFRSEEAPKTRGRVQLFGSGAILRHVLEASRILAETYQISSDVWSVTSYTQLRRDAQSVERWNMLHPDQPARKSYIQSVLEGVKGPIISASDNVRAVGEQLMPYLDQDYYVLGCDGMGRSETRPTLRRHFEVDAASVAIAALYRLSRAGIIPAKEVAQAIKDLGVDPEKPNPLYA